MLQVQINAIVLVAPFQCRLYNCTLSQVERWNSTLTGVCISRYQWMLQISFQHWRSITVMAFSSCSCGVIVHCFVFFQKTFLVSNHRLSHAKVYNKTHKITETNARMVMVIDRPTNAPSWTCSVGSSFSQILPAIGCASVVAVLLVVARPECQ